MVFLWMKKCVSNRYKEQLVYNITVFLDHSDTEMTLLVSG